MWNKFLTLASLATFLMLSQESVAKKFPDATESELSFLEFYAKNKDILNPEAPFDYSLESFAEHHSALVSIMMEYEKNYPYEAAFPVEGVMTSSSVRYRQNDFFKLILQEAFAFDRDNFCVYGGWPSKMKNGKCNAPWKNAGDSELKKMGDVYDSSFYCGGEKKFRCNPTFFGPGKEGKGLCITFSSPEEISLVCERESRQDIGKIYERFKSDDEFKKNYLENVKLMKDFCRSHPGYTACPVLTLQADNVKAAGCVPTGENVADPVAPTLSAINTLSNQVRDTVAKTKPVKKAPKPKAEERPRPSQESVGSDKLCNLYRQFLRKGVPREPLQQALTFFNQDQSRFSNRRYISIGDYSQSSRNKRFYILDMSTGEVSSEKVSHGSGRTPGGVTEGDRDHDGMIDRCVNSSGARKNMTRPGFYATGRLEYSPNLASSGSPNFYPGKRLNKMILYGLSTTNSDALGSGVVMHEAQYNEGGNKVMGRSYGCPAFVPGRGAEVVNKILGGSLFYSYVPVCAQDMKRVLADDRVKNWENFCQ